MKYGGDMYAEWCRTIAGNMIYKIENAKQNDEERKRKATKRSTRDD